MSVTIDGTNGVTASASFYGQSTFTGTYTDGIVVDYTTGTGRITVGAADGLKIRNGGTASPTDLVTVDSSGNVGIGTSSPGRKLDVSGSARVIGSNGIFYELNNGTDPTYLSQEASGEFRINQGTAGANSKITFLTQGSERARIDSSGNLLVGTTSTTLSADGQWFSYYGRWTTRGGSGAVYAQFLNGSGSEIGRIANNSNSSTTYATSSDYRLKENIAPMTGALSVVQQLKPCTYTWKADGSDGQGFIAHELQEIVPDCVTGEKDAVDADGNPVYQGIDTSFLVATLTAAIQEQQALIQQLQADVAALKAA